MFDSHMSFKFHPKMGVCEGGLASLAKKNWIYIPFMFDSNVSCNFWNGWDGFVW